MSKRAVKIESGEHQLHARIYTPEQPNGTGILMTHGWMSKAHSYYDTAEACAAVGATCLAVDLLGHGKSTGNRETLPVVDYVHALGDAYDYLASRRGVDPERIGAVGGSFGGYLVSLLASTRDVGRLLLKAPALYPNSLIFVPRNEFDTQAVLNMDPEPHSIALRAVSNLRGFTVLHTGGKDEVITPAVTQAYADAIRYGKHVVLPDAGHRYNPAEKAHFAATAVEWEQSFASIDDAE